MDSCRARFNTVRKSIGQLPAVRAGENCPVDQMHYSAGHIPSTLATIRAVPKDGGNRPPDVGPDCPRRGKDRQGKAMYEDVYGRPFWDRPAITITAYARNPASGRFLHPEQDRALSVREAALLQGFPPDYWFSGSLDQRFRQIGNAVPPTFASYLACHIVGELLSHEDNAGGASAQGIARPVGESFSRMIPALKAGHRDALAFAF
jgi:DNA (cytosine-5)-methyltransferase 1